jgi:hypothetical protein
MSYSNPVTAVYRFPAAVLLSAAVVGRIVSPSGMAGRIVDVSYVITTATTVAASVLSVGVSGTPAEFGTLSVPVASANAGGNGATLVQNHQIDAGEVVEISTDGGSTAGAADLLVTVAWF